MTDILLGQPVGIGLFSRPTSQTVVYGARNGKETFYVAQPAAVLVQKWVQNAARLAETRRLSDGVWLATAAGIRGAAAEGESRREALAELPLVLFDWASLKIEDKDGDIPILGGIDLNDL